MKRHVIFGVLAGVLIPMGLAYGGAHSSVEVQVVLDATNVPISAFGNLADAFNSADSNQYIGCGGSPTYGWCQAHDATTDPDGLTSAFCFTNDPDKIAHIRSVSQDSYVSFHIDATTGECTSISVSHNSFYAPKGH